MRAMQRQQEAGLSPRPFPMALSLPFTSPAPPPLPCPLSWLSAGAVPASLGARGLDARACPVYQDKKGRWRQMYKCKQRRRQALEGERRERQAHERN